MNNSAIYGGGLYLNSVSILIIDSIFKGNNAEKGGSIYYKSN